MGDFDVQSCAKYFRVIKSVSVLIVLYSVTYHIFLKSKESRCETPLLNPNFNGTHLVSDACQTNIYNPQDSRRCLRSLPYISPQQGRKIVFVGDTKLRVLYEKFEELEKGTSEFIPYETVSSDVSKHFRQWADLNSYPSMVIFGFQPKSTGKNPADNYSTNISHISFELDQLAQSTPVLWLAESQYTSTFKVGNLERKRSMDKQFGRAAFEILSRTHVKFWNGVNPELKDISENTIEMENSYVIQLVLNLICNQYESNEDLCCGSSWEPQDSILFHCLIFGYTVAVLVTMLLYDNILERANQIANKYCRIEKQEFQTDKLGNESPVTGLLELLVNTLKLALILVFFYVCDRTSLFPSSERHFLSYKFYLPLLICLAVSIATWSQSTKAAVLTRDITDEWKGWMQIVILLYHASGASTVLPIYIYVRALVASYVFLTGFGHFAYYWSGKPMSFRRYCQVMVRMNLLTLLLCIVMENPYQVYYFVPLISFWFTALYVSLAAPPSIKMDTPERSNRDYGVALLKIGILTAVILGLSMSREIFDLIFMFPFWSLLFTRDHSDNEWWFRWKLDRFSVVYGMLFSLGYNYYLSRNSKLFKRTGLTNLLAFSLGVAMIIGLSGELMSCWTKVECNSIHPYIVWIPIIGFILLRHSTPYLEGSYSVFFSSIGKTSLELFICQYHIWLSASAKGLLILIPNGGFINIVSTTVVFVSVCYELRDVTSFFSGKLVPNENTKILRNIVLMICFTYLCSYLF